MINTNYYGCMDIRKNIWRIEREGGRGEGLDLLSTSSIKKLENPFLFCDQYKIIKTKNQKNKNNTNKRGKKGKQIIKQKQNKNT